MKLIISGIEFGFDVNGVNRSADAFRQFAEIEKNLDRTDEGTQGGHHGTDQAFVEFRVNENWVVRRVLAGDVQTGYLEAIAFPLVEQERQAKQLLDDEEEYERREREYEAQLRGE